MELPTIEPTHLELSGKEIIFKFIYLCRNLGFENNTTTHRGSQYAGFYEMNARLGSGHSPGPEYRYNIEDLNQQNQSMFGANPHL